VSDESTEVPWGLRYDLRPVAEHGRESAEDLETNACALTGRPLEPVECVWGLFEERAGLVGYVSPERADDHPMTMRITWALDACYYQDKAKQQREVYGDEAAEPYEGAARVLLTWAMGKVHRH
jgi:hypothetical protein